ncbi:MAG: PLD nuclease N-terminal domain-containing protein [Hyphomonadaceae bacterium]|nr:PLD nuclease N-terminal domain-containing protein [Hyphomonadaceae bacterium]
MFGQSWSMPVGLGFLVALVLGLWAVFHIAQSERTPLCKAVWCVLVLFVPYLGFILWLLFGPRAAKR